MRELSHALSLGQGLVFAGAGALIVFVAWLLSRRSSERTPWRRLAAPLALLLGYFAADALAGMSTRGSSERRYLGLLAVFFLLLALARFSMLVLLDWFFGRRLQREVPRIVRDIVGGTLVIVALLVALRVGGVDATSVLTTSALITAIIGLSLQDTLGNLIAGLSLQAQRPFAVGEWIQVDTEGRQLGQVVEINWRSTKVLTRDSSELVIPNAQLARSFIVNHSRPTRTARRLVQLTVASELAPRVVREVMLKALARVPSVLQAPPVTVVTSAFVDAGVQYSVHYYIDAFDRAELIDGQVRERIWSALARAGISIPGKPASAAASTDARSADDEQYTLRERCAAIRSIDFLQDLPDEAIAALARDARSLCYEPGEIVVRQGEPGDELYLCRSGDLVVLYTPEVGPARELARLQRGGMFGELAQLSGEPRSATVQAESACELLVIGKRAFSQILQSNPGVAELITQRMAERRATLEALERPATPEEKRQSVDQHKGRMLARLREFFYS